MKIYHFLGVFQVGTGEPPPPAWELAQLFPFFSVFSPLAFKKKVGTWEPPPLAWELAQLFPFFFAQPGGNIFGGSNNIMN